MLLAELVETTEAVGATRSRLQKRAALAALLRRLPEDEVVPAVGILLGRLRQGRIGVGWRGWQTASAPPAAESTLSLAELDDAFDRLAALGGPGSAAERTALLRELTGRATEAEQRFLGGVLLGEVRTGALEGVLLDAVAEAAELPLAEVRRAAMLSGELGETARLALHGAPGALAEVGLVVGRPVLPMLAATAATAGEAIAGTGEASVEFKLDGARIQVHRSGDEVRVFTRSLAEITERVPEVVQAALALPVRDVILDGETLALDEHDAPRPFQETMSRFGAESARETLLRPWFFDVLHVDGRDLIDEPLAVRRAELRRVAGELTIPGEVTADPEAAERVSRAALAAGHEGVVVKAIESPYAAGRRGASWVKVKPVYTYDLVVLGAEWGYGRRTGLLSNLHLGALDPEGEFGEPGGLVMVGKTFKGLTDALLAWQTERFPELEQHRTAQAVFIRPELVVEIAIDGVQRSSRYPGGVALRFARVKRYRDDKRLEEADTIQTLRALLPPAG
ncbi:ATP-dependent DNA ligase [Agromyces mediolanus]|uniref:Probable DNA ligase n=1 Tax=Agromyces mediolanus TaxID=41986 RepID=A0A918CM52_AGRME|nr:ATP-dependent DNA ligase [Agromyces mediolanus]GGR31373.1 DNA ligase [Agromyces mediolanus]GLJ72500.1 DNA ligase [Agromyces mediolanus]